MVNFGVGAEVAATIQDHAFLHLQAPVKRIAGWTTHTGLAYEKMIIPDVASKSPKTKELAGNCLNFNSGIYDAIHSTLEY